MVSAPRERPHRASIRAHLLVLISAATLPLLILVAVLGFANADAQRRVIDVVQRDVVSNLTHLLDREFTRVIAVLQTLADMPELDAMPSPAFRQLAATIATAHGLDAIGVYDRAGQLLATSLPLVTLPIRTDMTPIAAAFEDRVAISGFQIGIATKNPLFIVSVPIRRNGTIATVLTAGVGPARLSGLFAEAGLKADWPAAVVDRNGIFMSRSPDNALYIGSPARAEIVAIAKSQDSEGSFDNVTYEGIVVTNTFRRSLDSGWTVVVAVPRIEIDAIFWRTVAWQFPVGAALIGLSLLFALYVARRISAPVRSLGDAARALGEGRALPPPETAISDFRDVSAAFSKAAALAQELHAIEQNLAASDRRYRVAMSVGHMGSWETNLEDRTRTWTPEGMELFGLSLANGHGRVGGNDDEYYTALHPEDRHLMAHHHALAHRQDTFVSDYRIVRPDGMVRWLSGHAQVLSRAADGTARLMVNVARDITERKRAEQHALLLMAEVNHRAKNLLGVVQAMIRQTARHGDPETFVARVSERIIGLAASHDLLVENQWQGVDVAELITGQLAHFKDLIGTRVLLDGPPARLSAAAAQGIGMALHELATNAGKYGALSNREGQVCISWRVDAKGQQGFSMSWLEDGGPPVATPTRRGFGQMVIGPMAGAAVHGVAEVLFHASGIAWNLSAPIAGVIEAGLEIPPLPPTPLT